MNIIRADTIEDFRIGVLVELDRRIEIQRSALTDVTRIDVATRDARLHLLTDLRLFLTELQVEPK